MPDSWNSPLLLFDERNAAVFLYARVPLRRIIRFRQCLAQLVCPREMQERRRLQVEGYQEAGQTNPLFQHQKHGEPVGGSIWGGNCSRRHTCPCPPGTSDGRKGKSSDLRRRGRSGESFWTPGAGRARTLFLSGLGYEVTGIDKIRSGVPFGGARIIFVATGTRSLACRILIAKVCMSPEHPGTSRLGRRGSGWFAVRFPTLTVSAGGDQL